MSKKDLSIVLSPPDNSIKFIRGYIACIGNQVEAAAQQALNQVPQDNIASQTKRDGEHHHITLLTKADVSQASEGGKEESLQKIFEVLSEHITKDWIDVGLGSSSKGEDTANFKVIVWPSANRARQALGLPAHDFHITIGFKGKDAPELDRSPLSLVYEVIPTRRIANPHAFVTVALEEVAAAPAGDRQIEKSLALLGHALDVCGNSNNDAVQVLLARALLFGKAKRFNECLEDAQRVVSLAPDSYTGHSRAGAALFNLKMTNKANQAYTKAMELALRAQKSGSAPSTIQEDIQSIEKGLKICKKSLGVDSLPDPASKMAIDPRKRCIINVNGRDVKLPRNFSWLVDGQIAGMSIPKKRDHIEALRSLNITLVATAFDDPLPGEIFEGTGVRNIFFRVENYRGAAISQIEEFMKEAEATIRNGEAVCVHCGGGKGRAGTFLSCFMVRFGLGGVS